MQKFYTSLLFLFIVGLGCNSFAQNHIWTDSFTNNVAPTNAQITNWNSWRSSLTPGQYTFMTIKGTLDKTGITCTDKTIVNLFATAVQNYTTYISGTTGGHVWSICNRYLGEIWLDPPASCSGSNCPFGYIIRPGIGTGNPNWGGVNSNTCGGPTQRMTFIFGKPSKPNDMGVISLVGLDFCTNVQAITTKLTNYGVNKIDSFRLYWTINGNLQTPLYVTSNLASGRDTQITLNPSFSFTNNTTYQFKFWTHRPNSATDSVASNDTLKYTMNFFGNPPVPTTSSFIQCGNGKPTLTASTGVNSDTIMWFNSASGGNPIAMGKTVSGPFITATRTFYAQAYRFVAKTKIDNTFTGGTIVSGSLTSYNGNYFDVTAYTTLNVDSMAFRLYQNVPTTNYRLYYKLATFNGSETNAGAWTLINSGSGRFYIQSGQFFLKVSTKNLLLSQGQLYGFYFTTDPTSGGGNDIYMKASTAPTSNSDLYFAGGKYSYGLFGASGFGPTYTIDMEISYNKACINPNRAPLTVTVKPRPTGAEIIKGTPFIGQFRAGDISTPDIAEVGKTITYELVPPTGFTNSGHGTAWIINSLTARTRYGVLVPPSEYLSSTPNSGGPGTITFTPKSFYIDSFITFSLNYSDLGPYFCDSTIKRTLVVAPTPRPDFKFPASICLGDAVLFDNTTTIHSGNSSYTWYFGDGDSSDLQSPVHEYLSSGAYTVRLVAKSSPWNVLHDTSILVEVGELPSVQFKVNNKCEGLAVTFQNQTTVANGVLTYDWDFGDGSPHSTANNPSHLYNTPNGYKVTLKADANGCMASLSKNAYTFAKPIANFAVPTAPVCAKTITPFPNLSTISIGVQGAFWNFGDGTGSTQFEGIHSYDNAGTYNIRLLAVSEFDCKDSVTRQVIVKPSPNPEFVGNRYCGKLPTSFTNTTFEAVPNPVYNWNFSDGFTSTQKNLTRTWPVEGPYYVTLKVMYSNGCAAEITKTFQVLDQPKADFRVNDVCSGESASFVNLTKGDKGGINYFWDFGNGTNSSVGAPVRLYNPVTTTTYTVSLVASYNGGCSDTVSKTLTVSETPLCGFSFKDKGFLNTEFTPSNTSYTSYEWLFGEGGTSAQVSPTYKYAYKGSFKVTMKATNAAGCYCEITKTIDASIDIQNLTTEQGIKVYPNPGTGIFTVSNAAGSPMQFEVFNILGEKILAGNSAEGSSEIDLTNQAKGIYLVKVTIDGISTTLKLIIGS